MNQNILYDIGHEILQETFLLIRNVCSHPGEDFYSMKYVRDIVDAIHNIPHSIQKQSDKFLEFELKLLQETLLYMDFGKVAVQNAPYFRTFSTHVYHVLQKRHERI